MLFQSQSQISGRAQALAAQLPVSVPGFQIGASTDTRLVGLILGSRSFADSLAARIGAPESRNVQQNDNGSIVVEVTDEDPERAAEIANEYPQLINLFVIRFNTQTAQQKQKFLRTQIALARQRLEATEKRLVEFQSGSNAPALQQQANHTLNAAVQLQETIAELEIGISQLRRTVTSDNPRLRTAVAELEARREQLRELTSGSGSPAQVLLPLEQGPELQVASTRVLREYSEAEQLYAALMSALTDVQLEGENHLPVVNVLDPAIVPTQPSGPGTITVVTAAALIGVLLGVLIAILLDYVGTARIHMGSHALFGRGVEWPREKAVR